MKQQTALDRRAKKAAYDKARRARARQAKKTAAQPPKDETPPQPQSAQAMADTFDQQAARLRRLPPDISVRFEVRHRPRPLNEVERQELNSMLDKKAVSEKRVMESAVKVETLRDMLRLAEAELIDARAQYDKDTTKADALFSRLATP